MLLWQTAIRIGLPVFPCRADKRPACPQGFKDAVSDPQQIQHLFSEHPGELIGVPTGEVSGLDALDLDTARHPEAKTWVRDAGLPATRIHQTQSGGFHYFFRHAAGLRNWTSRPVVGVDGRADGGYVIWWPASGFGVNSADPIDWPARVLRLVQPSPRPQREPEPPGPINDAKLSGVLRRLLGAVNGERNTLLFWASCRCGEWIQAGDLARKQGEGLLINAALRLGLDESSSLKTIASGLETGKSDAVPGR